MAASVLRLRRVERLRSFWQTVTDKRLTGQSIVVSHGWFMQ